MEISQEDLNKLVDKTYDRIKELRKENKVLVQAGDSEFFSTTIENLLNQDLIGVLYDLNRLDEVQLALAKSKDEFPYINFLVNNLAMTTVIEYLYNKIKEIPQN